MIKSLVITSLLLMLTIGPSEARHYRSHHYSHHYSHHVRVHHVTRYTSVRHSHRSHYASNGSIVGHPVGCPHSLFCGCGVSVKVFGHPVANLYLASNWFRYPRTQAATGMVAVRSHHVMAILSVNSDGSAVVYDPNSGQHLTRVHTVRLTGYTVVNPHG